MIQSDKFDSSNMGIKNIVNSISGFVINRLINYWNNVVFSWFFIINCTNFIFTFRPKFYISKNMEIKNLLGFSRKLYIRSFFTISRFNFIFNTYHVYFFQVLMFSEKKDIFIIFENFFYTTVYSIIGSLFFSYFYRETFNLYINGNGGFVGNFVNQTFINEIINSNENIFYYFFIFLLIVLFLISINFTPKSFITFVKKIYLFILKEKNYTNKNEVINEYIPQEEIKNLIQEDLPFIKAETDQSKNKPKFKLPSIDLLKIPNKTEKEDYSKKENNNSEFLEKILLDFGVNGSIKKVSHGPVVTLNEFEPAAGVKVSKIINLSDDIARNTSSESR